MFNMDIGDAEDEYNYKIPTQIIENLYVGSYHTAYNKKSLDNLKITHILCCAGELKTSFPNNYKYLKIDLNEHSKSIFKQLDKGSEFIEEGMETGNVYVHCVYGMTRSTSMVAAYLMKFQGMGVGEAMDIVTTKRKAAAISSIYIYIYN